MIDVRLLIAHGLWIAGASALLAATSYYHWLARTRGETRVAPLGQVHGWRLSVSIALVTISGGFLLLPSSSWVARLAWSVVLASAVFDLWRQSRRR